MRTLLSITTALCLVLAVAAPTASAQNVLGNPSFDMPPLGGGSNPAVWLWFGNAYAEPMNLAAGFVPLSGPGLCSMFGNFTGGFNVTGVFQEFATTPGDKWELSCNARHWGGDPMVGVGSASCTPGCTDNWVVQKIAFFDASNTEIPGSPESTILDGTYAPDVWHYSGTIMGTAPAGAVKVQALILYLQPLFAGGAAHIDDVLFERIFNVPTTESTWGEIKALYR